ncbi:surfactant protein Bb isoform X1 [Lepisosteus oculatus]|uniref:surfactant protein Bb isoform X1 n=1 Tax=Lepisosteus oculatus TaxID=7918 RepID=UPI00073FB59A|nr:PREDICTED: pulmonary surfactant-associated protein B isoform X1 [Lepisosteus oculatus]
MAGAQFVRFFFFASLGTAMAGVVQKSGCALGPEFWCQDIRSAVQCGTVLQCMETVWNKDTMMESDSCKDCTRIFELLQDMLSNDDIEELMKRTADWFCKRLPTGETQKECIEEVDVKLPFIINFLINSVNPGNVCLMLGICKGQSTTGKLESLFSHVKVDELRHSPMPKGTNPQVQITPLCSICVLLIKKVEEVLPKVRTKEQIADLLGKVCSHLPMLLSMQCSVFVKMYGVKVIDFLLSYLAPHTICSLVYLCIGEESPAVLAAASEPSCEACLGVTALTQLTLGSNATEDQTALVLDTVCRYYPSSIPTCKNFTEAYKPKLQKVLTKPWDTHTMCQEVQACAKAEPTPLLGDQPCARGPSYWCADMQRALACNAVDHCKAHVWI